VSVALVALSDGRPGVSEAIASLSLLRGGPVTEYWFHDDSGDTGFRRSLMDVYQGWSHLGYGPRRGFTGMMRHVRGVLAKRTKADHIFWFETDFTLTRTVDLDDMARVLDEHPDLVQLALRRQPWSAPELAAGGVIEQWPFAYTDQSDGDLTWLEHRLYWTCNPSLFPRRILDVPWPEQEGSEAAFRFGVLADPAARAGYWGPRDTGTWCVHSGTRTGKGY
jgi:hypothetical protein